MQREKLIDIFDILNIESIWGKELKHRAELYMPLWQRPRGIDLYFVFAPQEYFLFYE